jgi:hypothetical protein
LATFTLHIKRKEKKITILRFLLLNASLGLHKYLLSISSGELLARGIVMKNEKLLQKDYLATYIYVTETSDQNNSKLDESNLYPENACQMSS